MVARSLAVVLATGVALPSSSAVAGVHGFDLPAADEARAKRLLEEGRDAYHLGDYATAVRKLEEAHAIGSDPVVLYHLGLAYARRHDDDPDVQHLRKARVVFLSYLEQVPPDAPLVSTVRQRLRELETRIAEADAEAETAAPPAPTLPDLSARRDRPQAGKLGLVGSLLASTGLLGALTGSIVGFTRANQLQNAGQDGQAKKARDLGYLSLGLGGAAILTGVLLAVIEATRVRRTDSAVRQTARKRLRLGPTGVEMSF